MFKIFTRTWWREADPRIWPDGLEPHAGKRTYIDEARTYDEARAICRAWNASHAPGRLSRKAEFEEA